MGQVSARLRRVERGYSHWCPGCQEMHFIQTDSAAGPNWSFDANVELPTFDPSIRIRCKKRVIENGEWTGEWHRDPDGKAIEHCCHYFIHAGQMKFCPDSTHPLGGKTVPLPELPDHLRD